MPDRTLTYFPLAQLQADPANPKAHALDTIGESIGRFGYVEPIVLDERTGFIVSGHGRTTALRRAKAKGAPPPEGVLLGEGGDWLVPVVTGWASKNDAEARGALIALNRTGQLGGWEDQQLLELLDQLSDTGDGYAGIGFDEGDLDDLRARLEELPPAGDIEVPEHRETEGGRGLIVLDYARSDYAQVTAWLKQLRDEYGTDSNADALLAHLADVFKG